ncbi:hypothetical protein GA0070609_3519 [Micromonospora echinaurantiaca]|uniref:WD40-like Beta Propeller Repeat n=1 Tax=Micromonospora echinaurantiaca TaxID=47857 RepID=A0A1C5IMY1_9ACTN|nr:hypothetical protein [Micromonospora echinaurantiaca]SCG59176.1 hypothetical protein GA0070609_3519 [Micromonospora echinaurantiaca]
MTGLRLRIGVFAGVVLLAFAGVFVYLRQVTPNGADATPAAGVPVRADVAPVVAGPHVVFRNSAPGDGYGRVAVVPLEAAGGPRAVTPASCDRVYATRGSAVCLVALRGLATTYQVKILGPQWTAVSERPVPGLPSRARMSADGALTSTTTFVYGDSYASPGQFSTRTLVGPTGGGDPVDIEQFELRVEGRTVTAADKNVWGVTFADDDRFYATAASGGRTWLVEGSLSGRRLTAVRADVECPSLSPDGTRIAFKKHGDLPAGRWRLTVLDLASGRETPLAEARSVDDQAEWLDDDTVLYGLPRNTDGSASNDVWSVPADGTGEPRVLIPDAWSPAVVR